MAEVAFHFNVQEDKLHYACRLLRKAWRSGHRCMVVLDGADVEVLDQVLWTFSVGDFIPHALAGAPTAMRQHSAILLGHGVDTTWPADVLVNLGQQVPAPITAFSRIVEVVSHASEDRQSARARWRHYAEQGHVLQQHDCAARTGA